MKGPSVRYPIRWKLAAFGGLLAVVPVLVVGFGLMEINASTLETQNREMRLTVAEDIAESIEISLRGGHEDLLGVQQILTNQAIDEDRRIDVATAMVESSELIDRVTLYDRSRAYIATIDQTGQTPKTTPLDVETAKRAASEPLVIGRPSAASGTYTIPIAIAIRLESGEVTGFLRSDVDLRRTQLRAEEIAAAKLSPASRVDVVDVDRLILVSSRKTEIGKSLAGAGMMKDLATIVKQGVAHSGEHPARPYLVSARPLRSLPLVTRVEVPLSEAYASLHRMRVIVAISTIAAALVALIFALTFAQRLTKPLDRLVEMTKSLAERAFDKRISIETNDEIAVVAQSLNQAAGDLQDSEEAIAREIAIRGDLGRYLPADLVDNIVRREQPMELGGERREITVLFADVVRFTPLCEHHDPEVVVSVLNELFTILTTIIFETGGTVDKFIGDCVMAFWGAPQDDPDHVTNALEAAEKMIRFLEFGNSRWMKDHGIEVQLAIGINSGEAVIGNIGSETRMEYTAIGGTVNTAARLEALANPGQVLVSEATAAGAAAAGFEFRILSTELLSVGEDEAAVFEVVL